MRYGDIETSAHVFRNMT